jgi:hypothetical protein|tara:strand:- start:671 stop:814 length:144 start_codon:yes stop_codon:yes gene_type:complete
MEDPVTTRRVDAVVGAVVYSMTDAVTSSVTDAMALMADRSAAPGAPV